MPERLSRVLDFFAWRVLEQQSKLLRWTGVEPVEGSITAGTAGVDYLSGKFHGPGHVEVRSVIDTDAFVGAFGAKRR